MNTSRRRRELILALTAAEGAQTQEQIVAALRAQGIAASQASVSRDIAALGLVKAAGRWSRPAAARPVGNPLETRVREFLLSVSPAGDHLLVLKTPPGEAQALAYAIDALSYAGLVGTVAGDDTVFAAVSDGRAGREIARRLRALGGQGSGT